MSTILLHHGGKTTTPFADAPVEKRLAELVPHLDNCSFQFVDWVKSLLVLHHLLQRTPDGEINRIKVQAVRRPHVWFNKLDVLALQVMQRVLRREWWSAVLLQLPLVSAASGVDVRQQSLCHYIVAVVLAVDLGTWLDEDDFCFAHPWHADRHHDAASFEILTRIRQVAPLLHIINFNNLCFRVENETTLISEKSRVDLSSISEVRSYITQWPRFLGHPVGNRTLAFDWRRIQWLWMTLNAKKGVLWIFLAITDCDTSLYHLQGGATLLSVCDPDREFGICILT